jgi:hypothetical protein
MAPSSKLQVSVAPGGMETAAGVNAFALATMRVAPVAGGAAAAGPGSSPASSF